jgi:GNAT superfamily N-acetyltransferase
MSQPEYSISTDRSRLDLELIYKFLTNCCWAKGIPRHIVERSIENSLCFGVFAGNQQIGFARVVTDYATCAYMGDVFIIEAYRGQDLSKRLIKAIMKHPQLQGLRRWSLVTRDAHGLYEQFGFTPLADPEKYMELHNADVYKRPGQKTKTNGRK